MFATKPKEKFSLQEFQDHFKTPHQTIKKHLEEFVKLRILNEDKRKRFLYYSLNLENPITLDALSICEKLRLQKRLDEETLLEVLYEDLSIYFKENTFIIFGSATNISNYNDIDLVMLGKTTNIEKIRKTLNSFERTFSKEVHFHDANIRKLTEVFKIELINKHIIMNNHDFVLRELYS